MRNDGYAMSHGLPHQPRQFITLTQAQWVVCRAYTSHKYLILPWCAERLSLIYIGKPVLIRHITVFHTILYLSQTQSRQPLRFSGYAVGIAYTPPCSL